jgi:hypothetical protein
MRYGPAPAIEVFSSPRDAEPQDRASDYPFAIDMEKAKSEISLKVALYRRRKVFVSADSRYATQVAG